LGLQIGDICGNCRLSIVLELIFVKALIHHIPPMKYYIYLFFGCLFFFSCKSNDIVYTANSVEGERIIFGNGGGFAGTVTTYMLFDNGQMFMKGPRKDSFVSHQVIEQKLCDQLFKNSETLGLKDMTVNDPGNMYYFIELVGKEEKKKLMWGGNEEVDPMLKAYYQNLFDLAKRKSIVKE
jgi:hypothetical protein